MKKKILTILLLAVMMVSSSLPIQAAEEIQVTINGQAKSFDQMPINYNDRVLVPFRGIFTELGATVEWNAESRSVTAAKDGTTVKLEIDSETAYVNDEAKTLDVPAMIVNDRTLVPIRFVSEALNASVDWDGANRTVIIKTASNSTSPEGLVYSVGGNIKRPIPQPEEFKHSNDPEDYIYYEMGGDLEGKLSNLPEGNLMLSNTDMLGGSVKNKAKQAQWGSVEKIAVTGQSFTDGMRVVVTNPPEQVYTWQLLMDVDKSKLKPGDVGYLTITARCVAGGVLETGAGKIHIGVQQNGGKSQYIMNNAIDIGSEWKTYYIPFEVDENFPLDEANIIAVLKWSYMPQTVEFGGLKMVNFGSGYELSDMPSNIYYYKGSERDAQWRKDALARIEEIRKGDINVVVKDANGNVIPDADVSVDMYESEFQWGCAISSTMLQNNEKGQNYRNLVLKYFNLLQSENDHKYNQFKSNPETANAQVEWALSNGIRDFHGHYFVNPNRDSGLWAEHITPLLNDREKLDEFLRAYEEELLTSSNGVIKSWVIAGECTYEPLFLGLEGYKDPKLYDMLNQWCDWAREILPDSELWISQHKINGTYNPSFEQEILDFFDRVKEAGVDYDGIAIQGHANSETTPENLLKEYDVLSERYGKRLAITEYDVANDSEDYKSNITRDVMIAMYSHPAVEGFYIWGPWDGTNGQMDRLMAYKDWSLKPTGEVFADLVYNKWWTREDGKTGTDGAYSTRGFFGDYEITASHNGVSKTVDVSCNKADGRVDVEIVLS